MGELLASAFEKQLEAVDSCTGAQITPGVCSIDCMRCGMFRENCEIIIVIIVIIIIIIIIFIMLRRLSGIGVRVQF
jgi:hypothetical protein